MSTGWRWIDDLGNEYVSKMSAAKAAVERPEATFRFSELSMAGTKLTDVTDEVREWARELAATPTPTPSPVEETT